MLSCCVVTTAAQNQKINLWVRGTAHTVPACFDMEGHYSSKIGRGEVAKWDVTVLVKAMQRTVHMLVPEGDSTLEHPQYHLDRSRFEQKQSDGTLTLADCVDALRIVRNNPLSHREGTPVSEEDYKKVRWLLLLLCVCVLHLLHLLLSACLSVSKPCASLCVLTVLVMCWGRWTWWWAS